MTGLTGRSKDEVVRMCCHNGIITDDRGIEAMDTQRIGRSLINPQQLAHLRASLYAQRSVSNREVSVLLQAYDDLVIAVTNVAQSAGSPGLEIAA